MKKPSGFTLVEVLIAISLFSLVAVIASNILVDVFRLEQKSQIENGIYEDVRLMMQVLTDEIQNGTIDYEEYFNINVAQEAQAQKLYGINYGIYASRFYDPGRRFDDRDAENPPDLGLECSIIEGDECEIYWTNSTDLNTGRNPFNGNGTETDINAFCTANGIQVLCEQFRGDNAGSIAAEVNELYLIDRTGTQKTILGPKLISGEDFALGMVRMEGADYDQNGVVDIFKCLPEFNCFWDAGVLNQRIAYPFDFEGVRVPDQADLSMPFDPLTSQFIPITPLRSTIKDLRFIITPAENPYLAFGEKHSQFHPTVTIILTVGLAADVAAEYPGEFTDITVQTTVAAGVKEKLNSYPPVEDVLRAVGSNETSWIQNVLWGL